MTSPALLPADIPEALAVGLLRHLEWQPDGFSVIFLFADVGPTNQLMQWLGGRVLDGTVAVPVRLDAQEPFIAAPEGWLDETLQRLQSAHEQGASFWLILNLHPADKRWNRARTRLLARLNERRFLLEQNVKAPVVLVFPPNFKDAARRMAPDLWHVRAFSAEAAAPSVPRALPHRADLQPEALVHGAERPAEAQLEGDVTGLLAAWKSSLGSVDEAAKAAVFLPLSVVTIKGLLAEGRPAEASEVAGEAVALARRRVPDPPLPAALRDVSVSLDNVGLVARAQGDWPQAESAYRESLEIRRQLVQRLGGTPEALDDVASALASLALLPNGQSAGLMAEAIAIYERLAQSFPQVVRYAQRLAELRANGVPKPKGIFSGLKAFVLKAFTQS